MDSEEFRKQGIKLVNFIADYHQQQRQRKPSPDVKQGFLAELLPEEAPQNGEQLEEILNDLNKFILPGMVHWQNPHFHGYYTLGHSFPSLLGEMASDGMGTLGFSWDSNPASTELEMVVMNWLASLLHLPEAFFFSKQGKGGGILQTSACESTLIALLSARTLTIHKTMIRDPFLTQGRTVDRLIAYTNEECHSSVERAALMGLVKLRALPTDDNGSLRGKTLEQAVRMDLARGLIPFFCCATIGSTPTCAFDNLPELGTVCHKYGMWLHVDGAYAVSACICPEYRHLLKGMEVTSITFNLHKLLLVNWDCSAMWVRHTELVSDAFVVNPLFLKSVSEGAGIPEYRHWSVTQSKPFRSLKVWFVLRMYGVEGLQKHIRKHVSLGEQFASLVKEDRRFELVREQVLGLVCFRFKGPNVISERLCKEINNDKRIKLTPAQAKGVYFLRFVPSNTTEPKDVIYAWTVVQQVTDAVVKCNGVR